MGNIFEESTILLVDDVAENLTVLGSIFSSLGTDLIAVQEGSQAIEISKQKKPDLILLDINMPGMNGFEVCKTLKEIPETKDIPVIFVSAKVSSEDISRGFESGAVDYVTKPYNHSELKARAQTHLKLSKAIRDKEKLLKDKDKFISLVAHDIKSPLSGVMSLMHLLSHDYDSLDESERREMIDDLYKSLESQYKFVVDLLDWGRLQLDRVEINKEEIHPEILLNAVTSIHKLNAEKKGIELNTKVETDDVFEADPTQMETILTNIISNAIKFTKSGGSVDIGVTSDSNSVTISIMDNGVGMKDDDKAKLFKDDTIHTTPGTNEESGTGLGLLLVRELVQKNDGNLSFESEYGVGTTFYISFPKS
jgi:signal transduction histidine kinase